MHHPHHNSSRSMSQVNHNNDDNDSSIIDNNHSHNQANNIQQQQDQQLSQNNENNQSSKSKNYIRKFRRCCCHHAPAVIILDIIIILILIGEIILIQDKNLDTDNSSGDSYTPPTFNYTFTYGNTTYYNSTYTTNSSSSTSTNSSANTTGFQTTLYEVSASSVIIIPLNSFLIAIGLRLLFCKIQMEFMKFSLIAILFLLYISSMIGLTLYSSQSNQDLFKQNFFLQYIILTISLVLGFLTEAIALLMMAYYFMKVMQVQIKKVSHLYLIEQQEALLSKSLRQQEQQEMSQSNNLLQQQQVDQSQQQAQVQNNPINQSLNTQHNLNNPVSGIVRALTHNTNYIDQAMTNQNLIENSQADITNANLLSPTNHNNPPASRIHNGLHSFRQTLNSARHSQNSFRNNNPIARNNQSQHRQHNVLMQQRSHRSQHSQRSPGRQQHRFVMNGLYNNQQQDASQPQSLVNSSRSRESRQPLSLQYQSGVQQHHLNQQRTPMNQNDRSNNSSFTFVDQCRSRHRSINLFRSGGNGTNNIRSGSNSQRSALSAASSSSSQQNNSISCSICTLQLISNIVKMRGCEHMYHKNCLQQWTRMTFEDGFERSNNQQQCPICNLQAI